MYDETMSLACQRGQCGPECPEADDPDGYCACVCHIPDDSQARDDDRDEVADEYAQAWYENYYGTART